MPTLSSKFSLTLSQELIPDEIFIWDIWIKYKPQDDTWSIQYGEGTDSETITIDSNLLEGGKIIYSSKWLKQHYIPLQPHQVTNHLMIKVLFNTITQSPRKDLSCTFKIDVNLAFNPKTLSGESEGESKNNSGNWGSKENELWIELS